MCSSREGPPEPPVAPANHLPPGFLVYVLAFAHSRSCSFPVPYNRDPHSMRRVLSSSHARAVMHELFVVVPYSHARVHVVHPDLVLSPLPAHPYSSLLQVQFIFVWSIIFSARRVLTSVVKQSRSKQDDPPISLQNRYMWFIADDGWNEAELLGTFGSQWETDSPRTPLLAKSFNNKEFYPEYDHAAHLRRTPAAHTSHTCGREFLRI